jgi:hypothetical protein
MQDILMNKVVDSVIFVVEGSHCISGPLFFLISIPAMVVFFVWQFSVWKVDDPGDCGAMFEVRDMTA